MEKKGIDYFYSCGRCWLTFDGYAIAMRGDLCRDPDLREMFKSNIWEDDMIRYVAERCVLPVSEIKEDLKETIISLESEIERLTKIQRAAIEIVDGASWWELQEQTGINEDRCKEILSIIRDEA